MKLSSKTYLHLLFVFLSFLFILSLLFHTPKSLPVFDQQPINPGKLSGEYDPLGSLAYFENQTITVPKKQDEKLAKAPASSAVLGESSGEKRIEVDLTHQKLYAFEGDRKVFDFLISSGKWYPTPTGEFRIWIKLRYVRMTGGDKSIGTYYDLPNVPFTMFFYNDQTPKWKGFGLHGTYWHNNFGHPMSHGCVNMRIADAEQLYYWVNPDLRGYSSIKATDDNLGTKVIIYGTTPDN